MSLPQKVEPGMLAFGTRRCVEGLFSLKPIAAVNAIIWYAFAVAVITHGVTPHALVAMSNHLHWLVTDVRGNLPDFKRDFHRMVAAAIKKLWGLEGTVFSDTNCRHVEVLGLRGAIKQALYCVLNPVRAHLVEHAMQWPGALWRPGMREVTVKKPDVWFTGAQWPEEITIRFEPPAAWTGGEDGWHERLGQLLADEEATLARERLRTGTPVLGAQRVRQQHHRSRPRTKLPANQLDPAIATGGDHELEKQAKAALKAWRRAYREALERWKADKATCFPRGSYWVVVHHGAAVAA
jgi:hypothetical protein